MKFFKNTKFVKRDYEATNIAACLAESAPGPQWVECDESYVAKMNRLWTNVEGGITITYYGWL
jgi:hypothetical protein